MTSDDLSQRVGRKDISWAKFLFGVASVVITVGMLILAGSVVLNG